MKRSETATRACCEIPFTLAPPASTSSSRHSRPRGAKDPDALLIYNDYNAHKPGKREKVIELLTQLKRKGAPVDAYGMQGHFELGDDAIPQLRETFNALRKLGIKVVVSELDIDVVRRGRWWAENGKYRDELAKYDPYKNGIPDEIERKQAEQYVALFKLFDQYTDLIARSPSGTCTTVRAGSIISPGIASITRCSSIEIAQQSPPSTRCTRRYTLRHPSMPLSNAVTRIRESHISN